MKKKLIYAAVVSALLAGCGGSDDNKGDTSSYLDYLLTGSNAVGPSALAARAWDGTLKFSTETADLSNPVSAMSTLDGWSTTQAIQIVPVTSSGITVQAPTTAEFGASVAPLYLLEVTFDSTALRPSGVKKVLTYGVDFVVAASAWQAEPGSAQAVEPLPCLANDSGHRTAERQSRRCLKAGSDYGNYKNNAGSNAQEQTINGLIALQEGLFKAATGIATDHVIFSDWFGTQSGADVLVAVKGAAASVLKADPVTLDAAKLWKQDAWEHQPARHLYPGRDRPTCLPDPAGCRAVPAAEQKDAIATAFGPVLRSTRLLKRPRSIPVPSSCLTSSPHRRPQVPGARPRPSPGTVPSQPVRHRQCAEGVTRSDRRAGGGGRGSGPAGDADCRSDPPERAAGRGEQADWGDAHLRRQAAGRRAEHWSLQPAADAGRGAIRADACLRQGCPQHHHGCHHLSARRDLGQRERLRPGAGPDLEDLCRHAGGQEGGAGGDRSSAARRAWLRLSGSMDTVTTSDNPTPYLNLSYLTVARDNLKQSVAICWACVWRLAWPTPRAIGTAGSLKVHFLGHSLGASRVPTCCGRQPDHRQRASGCPVQVRYRWPGHAGSHSAAAAELADFGPTIKMGVLTSGSAELKAGFTAYAPNCTDGGAYLLRQRVPAEPGRGHSATAATRCRVQLCGPVGAGFG
uniref:Extracellular lipase n=1 Tax=Aeromonas hydrophila TaxID=644 RepID=LIPE_AERHY|nr:RecName: Full=Extracellular lipase; AltName: Full=Triacylglycerol lipase; Flags: Precursor [Aeromonas hydrophila]AAB28083.2 extracellular lipase [Aeromonas hydrophila]